MTGKDIIKKIIDEDGLDKEYNFSVKKTSAKKAPVKTKVYKTLDDMIKDGTIDFEIDAENGEVIMNVEDPKTARKFGLSDRYVQYIWDGNTMYFYESLDKPCSWSISFGGGSTTLVADSVVKYRNTAAKQMIKAAATSKKKTPAWMNWRISHYNQGKDIFNVFA